MSGPLDEKRWLANRIEAALKEMSTWPNWMIDAAKFEGSLRDGELDVVKNIAKAKETT